MNGQWPPNRRGGTQWFSLEYFLIFSLHTTPTCSMLPASHLFPSRRPPSACCLCFISCLYSLRSSDMKTSRNLNVCALSTWREGSDQCLISSCRIPLSLCCLGVRLFTEHHHDFVVSFYLVPVCCHRFSCDKPNDRWSSKLAFSHECKGSRGPGSRHNLTSMFRVMEEERWGSSLILCEQLMRKTLIQVQMRGLSVYSLLTRKFVIMISNAEL